MHESVSRDVVELRQWLVKTWTAFQQSIVDKVIEQWSRLSSCVGAEGDHFEHLL